MTTHHIRTRLVAGALVAGVILGVPGVALASSGSTTAHGTSGTESPLNPATKNATTFGIAKRWVEHQLALREQRLSNLTTEVSKAAHLASSDKAALTSDLAAETSGIDALAAKVPGDTTWSELQADGKAMVVDYRVFVVMSPQVHLTIAADTASTVEQKLQAAEPEIQAAIAAAQAAGKNVTAAENAYQDLVTQVADAANDTNGVSSTVLAQTPAGYPGNAPLFLNARSSLEQARTALRTARTDLHVIAHVLGL